MCNKQKDVDLEKGTISTYTAKNGNPMVLTLKGSTLAMFKEYVAENGFGLTVKMFPTPTPMRKAYCRTRRHLAKKLHAPELMKIHNNCYISLLCSLNVLSFFENAFKAINGKLFLLRTLWRHITFWAKL